MDLRKGIKKKPTTLGEQASPDLKSTSTHDQVDNTARREPGMTLRDPQKRGIGNSFGGDAPAAFGDSETKSLGRAMQENKTDNVVQDLAKQLTDKQIEALKQRARARANQTPSAE